MLVRADYPQIDDPAPKPFGNYVNGNVIGKLLLVSSAAPQDVNGEFGTERGAHARIKVGVDSMPFGVALEITIEYGLE